MSSMLRRLGTLNLLFVEAVKLNISNITLCDKGGQYNNVEGQTVLYVLFLQQ